MINRRAFLGMGLAGTSLLGSGMRLSLAAASGESRFVFVLLRGGMDGLAAVPAYGDSAYRKQRGALAIARPGQVGGALDLDGFFGLHPAFSQLHSLYRNQELIVAHAGASSYRERSHFDAQKQLENGTNSPLGSDDGWLNRALLNLPGTNSDAIALSQTIPLILHGDAMVNSWSPAVLPQVDDDTIDRIAAMYQGDAFFMDQFQSALDTRKMAGEMNASSMGARGAGRRNQNMQVYLEAAARFLREEEGPRIAVLESNGWDTHANQGGQSGQLANKFAQLDASLSSFREKLGSSWSNTVVVVVSEFGRTVAVNGSNGTDHGTAGASFILGGAVAGGKVVADWPGLSRNNLYQGRDLRPTLDIRSLFKSVLHDHMQVSSRALDRHVFPDSKQLSTMPDLIRS